MVLDHDFFYYLRPDGNILKLSTFKKDGFEKLKKNTVANIFSRDQIYGAVEKGMCEMYNNNRFCAECWSVNDGVSLFCEKCDEFFGPF